MTTGDMNAAEVFSGLGESKFLLASFYKREVLQKCMVRFVAQFFFTLICFSLIFRSSSLLSVVRAYIQAPAINSVIMKTKQRVTSKPRHASAELHSLFSSLSPQQYCLKNFLHVSLLVGKTQGTQGLGRTAFCIKLTLQKVSSLFRFLFFFFFC